MRLPWPNPTPLTKSSGPSMLTFASIVWSRIRLVCYCFLYTFLVFVSHTPPFPQLDLYCYAWCTYHALFIHTSLIFHWIPGMLDTEGAFLLYLFLWSSIINTDCTSIDSDCSHLSHHPSHAYLMSLSIFISSPSISRFTSTQILGWLIIHLELQLISAVAGQCLFVFK